MKQKKSIKINGLGKLYLNHDNNSFFWFATVQNVEENNLVELTIEVKNEEEPTHQQIKLISDFVANIESVQESVLRHLEESFCGSKWEKSKKELAVMYYLTAITLRRNQDLLITFEPVFSVESIFNFFPRFTIKDYQIVWSNI